MECIQDRKQLLMTPINSHYTKISVRAQNYFLRQQENVVILSDTCHQIMSCLSVCLSAWNNLAPTGRFFMEFDILLFFRKSVQKIQVSLKSDDSNKYRTWRPMYIYGNISANSLQLCNSHYVPTEQHSTSRM
jgi:hypothetical protein